MPLAPCRSGFTLIELLLVCVILALAAGLAVPSFIRSYRSAKLRTSARSVVMAGRYARAMAALQQKYVAVLLDSASGTVEIVGLGAQTAAADQGGFLDERKQKQEDARAAAGAGEKVAAPSPSVAQQLTRRLAEGVRIVSVSGKEGTQEHDGIYWVNYFPNGMCDEYTVRLADPRGKTAEITVDPLSGRAKVEYAR